MCFWATHPNIEDHCHAHPSSIWSQKEKRIRLRALERNLGSRPCVGGARGWHECRRSRWSGSCRRRWRRRRRRRRRRSGSWRRKWERWGRRSSSSPEWPNRAGLPSGHGLGWQGSKVPGYAQRRTHWARSDRIRGCARPAAVGRKAGVAPTVTSGQCATRSDSSSSPEVIRAGVCKKRFADATRRVRSGSTPKGSRGRHPDGRQVSDSDH